MTLSRSLREAYRSTRYVARTPAGPVTIRIGMPTPDVDALLDAHFVRAWAFVTACNPRSRELDDAANRARLSAMQARLRDGGYAHFPGAGEPATDAWRPEPSFLILGIARDAALALGREYEQNAIVFGECGGVAELLECFPEPGALNGG